MSILTSVYAHFSALIDPLVIQYLLNTNTSGAPAIFQVSCCVGGPWTLNKAGAVFPGGFPGSSTSKESACNAGDLSSSPGSGRSAREGIGYPLQYS